MTVYTYGVARRYGSDQAQACLFNAPHSNDRTIRQVHQVDTRRNTDHLEHFPAMLRVVCDPAPKHILEGDALVGHPLY